MANSTPRLKQELLDAIGAADVEELFAQIPAAHRLQGGARPAAGARVRGRARRHLSTCSRATTTCERNLSFLGGGCWQHHVPAICDEIVAPQRVPDPVWGTPSSDHGRNQAWFEFASQLGELIEMDFVGLPVYSWGCAAGHAIRMAARLTGRSEVLVPRAIDPERLAVIRTYCEPPEMAGHVEVELVDHDAATGRLDLADLAREALDRAPPPSTSRTPASSARSRRARRRSPRSRAAPAPRRSSASTRSRSASLAPPSEYGADIVVGSDHNRSASTCPAAAARAASSPPATRSATRASTRRST